MRWNDEGPGGREARGHWPVIPLAVLFGILAIVLLVQAGPGRSALKRIGLVKPPPAFAALYFTDPVGEPVSVPVGRSRIPLSFTVGNGSQQNQSYHWSVLAVQGSKTKRLATGEVSVHQGGISVVRKTVTQTCKRGTLKVTIELASPSESIDFVASCGE